MRRASRSAVISSEDIELKQSNGLANLFDMINAKKDVLSETSAIIYDHYRQQRLEGKIRAKLVLTVSVFLAASVIVIICALNYDEYFAYINQRTDYVNSAKDICNSTKYVNIDFVSTPIAAALLILYVIIYRRRVFLRRKFKYRNLGLPMIVSCWNKVLYINYLFGKEIVK